VPSLAHRHKRVERRTDARGLVQHRDDDRNSFHLLCGRKEHPSPDGTEVLEDLFVEHPRHFRRIVELSVEGFGHHDLLVLRDGILEQPVHKYDVLTRHFVELADFPECDGTAMQDGLQPQIAYALTGIAGAA